MAISVAWATKIIFVPQADLTFVSGTLYSLDTNQFRKDLKALEAGVEGMAEVDTHRHNTEVTIAGVTYARFVEIINGYTVEFEDGQYAVILEGANNNIFDEGIIVRNQVSIISTNSAGLVVVAAGGGSVPTAAQIADAVWDEPKGDHLIVDSTGERAENTSVSSDRAGSQRLE